MQNNKKAILFAGQGAQFRGMGKSLFSQFPGLVKQASEVLGYDLEQLCLEDPDRKINNTQFTQPALYTVNALQYLALKQNNQHHCDYFAGHSLGEYNALHAAGVFDFVTGLQLVAKRGQLMQSAQNGGMLAILGIDNKTVEAILVENKLQTLAVANYNTPTQTIVSGPVDAIEEGMNVFKNINIKALSLNVKGAFHSYMMADAQKQFESVLAKIKFLTPEIPVIANVDARPYDADNIKKKLAAQLSAPVQWCDSVRYLMGQGVEDFIECSAQPLLTKMVDEIRQKCTAIIVATPELELDAPELQEESFLKEIEATSRKKQTSTLRFDGKSLGSEQFKYDYGVDYAYSAGSMYRGISSKELVVKMGQSKMMSFLGAGGLSLEEIDQDLDYIYEHLGEKGIFGVNLLCNLNIPEMEMKTVELLLHRGVRFVEASAFVNTTPALVYFRVSGLSKNGDEVICKHRVLAKLSRPEVAEVFLSPAPLPIVNDLLESGLITPEQAELSQQVPMSHEICIEADSGGHTDMGIPSVLFPAIKTLRDKLAVQYQYCDSKKILLGLAGGIGSPESAAASFFMGADFIVTGSINQCTVESGASDAVKTMLEEINVQDTDYAPAGDMFEIGAKIQILKKGTFFGARANKLFRIYTHFGNIDEIPKELRKQIERDYFKRSFDSIWQESEKRLLANNRTADLERAKANPKYKMCLIFKWYFYHSSKVAVEGNSSEVINFQVHTGPALGAFNQWIKGQGIDSWQKRHVDEIGKFLMNGTAEYMQRSLAQLGLVA